MTLPITLTLATYVIGVIGAFPPFSNSPAGGVSVLALLVASTVLTGASEYRKHMQQKSWSIQFRHLLAAAEPPAQFLALVSEAIHLLFRRKQPRYASAEMWERGGWHLLEIYDAEGVLVGLFLFTSTDFGDLAGRKGRELEGALDRLLLAPVGANLDIDGAHRLSKAVTVWFLKRLGMRLVIEALIEPADRRLTNLTVRLDVGGTQPEPLPIADDVMNRYRSMSWPSIGADLVQRCEAWLGVPDEKRIRNTGLFVELDA